MGSCSTFRGKKLGNAVYEPGSHFYHVFGFRIGHVRLISNAIVGPLLEAVGMPEGHSRDGAAPF